MDKELFDNSSGDVVIRDGSAKTENSGAGGFFTIGGGGGFSGGFGGSSSKRAKKRARARAAAKAQQQAQAQAAAEAAAVAQSQAQAAARAAAHRQQVSAHAQAWETRQAVINQHFATRIATLPVTLHNEVIAATTTRRNEGPDHALFVANQAADELVGLIARKTTELQQQEVLARAFNGQDLLSMSVSELSPQLAALPTPESMQLHRQAWESSYLAAQDVRLLGSAIEALNDRLAQTRARVQSIELRNQQIRSKQQLDEDWRREWVREANTLTVSPAAMAPAGMVLGRAGTLVVSGAELMSAMGEMRALAAGLSGVAGPVVALVVVAIGYSPPLGNAELTPEQRRRQFEGVGIPADALGIKEGQDLQAIADAGGTARIEHRLRIEEAQGVTTLIGVGTGERISDQIPVRNAVLDPVTNTYRVEGDSPTDKHLVFTADPPSITEPSAAPQAPDNTGARLVTLVPTPITIPEAADLRFKDCIVCVPGQRPFYFSFKVPPVGQGMVHGAGQPASPYWLQSAVQPQGVAIPGQVGAALGGQEFESFTAFETALWQAVAYEEPLTGLLKGIDKRNVQAGYAPYAPANTWVGDRWRYEVRYPENVAQGTDPFDLGRIRIHLPSSSQGVGAVEPLAPWIAVGAPAALAIASAIAQAGAGSRTWTPLVPPGSQVLGPTVLPEEPALPAVYTGAALDPVLPQTETLPGLEDGEIGSRLPGYGDGAELPSSGLVFSEPLDVGPYDELGRDSLKDGLDIDHIVSRKALELFIRRELPGIKAEKLFDALAKAPSIAIPTEIHRKFSETYGGRNNKTKQIQDSLDLKAAVDSNVDAIKSGLIEYGLKEADIESAREKIHELHRLQGWIK